MSCPLFCETREQTIHKLRLRVIGFADSLRVGALLSKCYNLLFENSCIVRHGSAKDERARGIPPRSQQSRGVAQPGRAPGSGPGGRRFKSSLPDHLLQARH